MSPILINLGFIQIRWYSVLILTAFVLGYFLVIKSCAKRGIETSKVTDLCFYLVIVCILGARLYYCLFNLDYYSKNLLDIFKIWEGGLAIHGGIIAGLIFICFYTRKKDINMLELLDIMAPALALGQAIGRWGNFFNQEAFGPVVTRFRLRELNIPKFIIDNMYINGQYHHPTFFYESIGCLVIFIILMVMRNSKKIRKGQIVSVYMFLYGIIRFFIEGLRQDSLMFFNLKIAQVVSIIMCISGVLLFLYPYLRRKYDK